MADLPPIGIDWHLTPAQLTERCDTAIAAARAGVDAALAMPAGERSFASTLRPIEEAIGEEADEVQPLTQLYLLSPDSATRAASVGCSQKNDAFGVEMASDTRIFEAAKEARNDPSVTDAEDWMLVERYLETGRRNGAGLADAKRARVKALFQTLNGLERDFGARLAADSSSIAITADEADGLAPQFVATLESLGSGYRVPVNESTLGTFLPHEKSESARERFYVAYKLRGGQENVRRIEAALAVRDTLAHLLGFDTWAAYQLDGKMAKSVSTVVPFLQQIDSTLLPKAHDEVDELAALKRQDDPTDPLRPWDLAYYAERLRQSKYALDEQVVRQYFPVDHVVPSVLDVYQTLLGVRFTEVEDPDVWAPDVRAFRVNDAESGEALGLFYLDLFPRPHKYGHFAAFSFHERFERADGSVVAPVCGIVGNWPTPAPDSPSLLSHGDVVSFFHEFGHVMHCVLGRTRYPTTSSFSVRWDFVEAPSQMLENWAWDPGILARISKNVDTGEPLPDSLVQRILQVRHLGDGRRWTRQAFYAMYDMTLHGGTHVDPTELWSELSPQMSLVDMVPGTYPEAAFGHLMGGYDAGYYGYLWSKVYAEDMFSRFAKEGLLDPVTGRAYREDVLAPGASEEPGVLVERFLGRPVDYGAFYRSIGVEGGSAP